MTHKFRLGISGASGRMGVALLNALVDNDALQLVGALAKNPDVVAGVHVSDSLDAFLGAEVIVDFSSPEGFGNTLEFAVEHRIAFLSGTTGLGETHLDSLKKAAHQIPVLHASNFSIGVNLLTHLVELASKAAPEFDIEVFEAHHRHKVDAPGGTALMLGRAAAEAREHPFGDVANFSRQGHTGPRSKNEIGYQVLRGGSVVGEHTVFFLGDGERIELTHRAMDRGIFAAGALRAAVWLGAQPAGNYTMANVLFD